MNNRGGKIVLISDFEKNWFIEPQYI